MLQGCFRVSSMIGQVLFGINNIYTVSVDGREFKCRIKGKILKTEKKFYNPVAVGDYVELNPDPISEETGWIYQLRERRSSLLRWNKKRKAAQVIAANADLLVCICSVESPPFRPRFIDRLLISGDLGDLLPMVIINKCDLGLTEEISKRLAAYQSMGYQVIRCSAINGQGIAELEQAINKQTAVFAGQSGVGKSHLLNCLEPGLNLKIREVSSKFNRGVHTTNYSVMINLKNGSTLIDTPGIREFELAGLKPEELHHYFRDFLLFAPQCSYYACMHIKEPGCAVRDALEDGKIHPDRYESYLRIYDHLKSFQKEYYGSAYD